MYLYALRHLGNMDVSPLVFQQLSLKLQINLKVKEKRAKYRERKEKKNREVV